MEDLVKQYLATLIRNVGAPVFAWLLAKGLITDNQLAQLVALIVGLTINLVWGLFNKYVNNKKVETALMLPGGSSKEKLKEFV